MLRHPTWRHRIAWVHRLAGAVRPAARRGAQPAVRGRGALTPPRSPRPPPCAQLPLLAPHLASAGAGPEERAQLDCRVFLSAFLLLVGLVVPALLLAKLLQPMEAAAAAAVNSTVQQQQQQHPGGGRGTGSGSGERQQRSSGPLQRCLAWLQRCASGSEAALLHLCRILLNAVGSPLLTFLAWWVVASLVWVAALLLEQPHLALGAAPGGGSSSSRAAQLA